MLSDGGFCTVPLSGCSSALSIRRRVVLPEPFTPISPVLQLSWMEKLTWSRRILLPYCFETFSKVIIGGEKYKMGLRGFGGFLWGERVILL